MLSLRLFLFFTLFLSQTSPSQCVLVFPSFPSLFSIHSSFSSLFLLFHPPIFSSHLLSLTPIFSLFSLLPSPPLHFIIWSVLFYHSFLLRPSISLSGWRMIAYFCLIQPHACTHAPFILLMYSACIMSSSRLTAEVLMLRGSGGRKHWDMGISEFTHRRVEQHPSRSGGNWCHLMTFHINTTKENIDG